MQKHTFNGYIASSVDPRDDNFLFSATAGVVIPAAFSVQNLCSPIEDQGQEGTCTCEAACGLLEFNRKPTIKESVLFPYYNSAPGNGDTGREPRTVLASLLHDGNCLNRYWPYSRKVGVKPSASAYAHATMKISSYHSLTGLSAIKAWIATMKTPAYIGFTVYSSFEDDSVAKTGIMPMPAKDEEVLGGHMVDAVGYDDSKQWLVCRNSWGKSWGAAGYFFMPYKFVTKANVSDMWAVVV
jgi:C1A family cysteine protease